MRRTTPRPPRSARRHAWAKMSVQSVGNKHEHDRVLAIIESLRVTFPAACGVTCSRQRARRLAHRSTRKAHRLFFSILYCDLRATWHTDLDQCGADLDRLHSDTFTDSSAAAPSGAWAG